MFENETKYKFELPGKIFYTGYVIEEDENIIRIKTIFNEIKIINKTHLVQAWELDK